MKERLKVIVCKMWTGMKSVGRRAWGFLKSKEGRQMVIQMVIVWGGEIIKNLFGS